MSPRSLLQKEPCSQRKRSFETTWLPGSWKGTKAKLKSGLLGLFREVSRILDAPSMTCTKSSYMEPVTSKTKAKVEAPSGISSAADRGAGCRATSCAWPGARRRAQQSAVQNPTAHRGTLLEELISQPFLFPSAPSVTCSVPSTKHHRSPSPAPQRKTRAASVLCPSHSDSPAFPALLDDSLPPGPAGRQRGEGLGQPFASFASLPHSTSRREFGRRSGREGGERESHSCPLRRQLRLLPPPLDSLARAGPGGSQKFGCRCRESLARDCRFSPLPRLDAPPSGALAHWPPPPPFPAAFPTFCLRGPLRG